MDKETLFRYLKCRTSEAEERQIAAWLEAAPENRQTLDRMRLELETLALAAPAIDAHYAADRRRAGMRASLRRWSVAAAAVVAFGIGVAHFTARHVRREIGSTTQLLAAQDAPVRYTLSDGTSVWLNSRSTLEYPALFTGRQRTVRITGEAMFDVTHDARHPFVVRTAACDIRVLGTQFNVVADGAGERFETALIRGRIEVFRPATSERIVLAPDERLSLEGGTLVRGRIADRDDFLWTDGYINLKGHSFAELIQKFREVFAVEIVIDGVQMPDTRYQWGKIRIRDGADNAMKVLQNAYPIRYTFDSERNRIVVKNR